MVSPKQLTAEQTKFLLDILRKRFEENHARHRHLSWNSIQASLCICPEKMWSLNEMEKTGGEPDVIDWSPEHSLYFFCDCAKESPAGRRSLCYDNGALESRKTNKPKNSAAGVAAAMGIALLDEAQYRALQKLGEFDLKTSSWISTPGQIRKQGGALFCDRRYGEVFLYHNGAESYYAARGFRGFLQISSIL